MSPLTNLPSGPCRPTPTIFRPRPKDRAICGKNRRRPQTPHTANVGVKATVSDRAAAAAAHTPRACQPLTRQPRPRKKNGLAGIHPPNMCPPTPPGATHSFHKAWQLLFKRSAPYCLTQKKSKQHLPPKQHSTTPHHATHADSCGLNLVCSLVSIAWLAMGG